MSGGTRGPGEWLSQREEAAGRGREPLLFSASRGASESCAVVSEVEATESARLPTIFKQFGALVEMTGIKLSLLVALAAASGYLLSSKQLTWGLAWTFASVFLLSGGARMLNQIQEQRLDALMPRTQKRPLPTCRIGQTTALAAAALSMASGLLLLFLTARSLAPALLSGAAIALYNGCYTYLKRITAFAAFPGSLVGAIPPAIGWSAAHGDLSDPLIIALSSFFLIWQVPHFWLRLLAGKDEYERAGLPSVMTIFAPVQLARITLIWVWSAIVASIAIQLFGGLQSPFNALLMISAALVAIASLRLLKTGENRENYRSLYRILTMYPMILLVLLSVGSVW